MKLSEIESEASCLCGRLPEEERRVLQEKLIALCRTHWLEIRGTEPFDRLERAIWRVDPPVADLFLDLYASDDSRLDDALHGLGLSQGLALVVLSEIEAGEEEEVRLLHEPMMLSDSRDAGRILAQKRAAFLRGEIPFPALHPHSSRPPVWKALALISERTKRCDASSAVAAMGLLSGKPAAVDDALERLRERLEGMGMRFLGIDDGHVGYSLHGREKKPLSKRQAGEILQEIRAMWLS